MNEMNDPKGEQEDGVKASWKMTKGMK